MCGSEIWFKSSNPTVPSASPYKFDGCKFKFVECHFAYGVMTDLNLNFHLLVRTVAAIAPGSQLTCLLIPHAETVIFR